MNSEDVQSAVNSYYKVFDNSMNSIMQSNMLTDEDSEVVQSHWHQYDLKPNHKALCTFTSLSCLSGAYGFYNNWSAGAIAIASCAPMSIYMLIKCNKDKCNREKELKVVKLIKCTKQVNQLNLAVVDFYEQRYSLVFDRESSRLLIKGIDEKSEEFLPTYIDGLCNFVQDLMSSIEQLKKHCSINQLSHYEADLKRDLKDFCTHSTDIKIVMEKFKELTDLFSRLISNFLACLGLTFCFDLWKADGCDVNLIFDQVIPNITERCKAVYDAMNEEFTHMRLITPPVANRKPSLKLVPLEKPLLDFLNQLQIVFDIGKGLERTLLKDTLKDLDRVLEYIDIMSLRFPNCQTALLAMQKMMVKYKKDMLPIPFENVNDSFEMLEHNECEVATVRYDDSIEALRDEEYELSVDRIEEAEEVQEDTEEVFENAESYRLVLHELNNKLHTMGKIKGIEDARSAELSRMMHVAQGTCEIPEGNLFKPIPVYRPPIISLQPIEEPEIAESIVSVPQDSDDSDGGWLDVQQYASRYNLAEETFNYDLL